MPFVAFQFWCGSKWWIPLAVALTTFVLAPIAPLVAAAVGRRLQTKRDAALAAAEQEAAKAKAAALGAV